MGKLGACYRTRRAVATAQLHVARKLGRGNEPPTMLRATVRVTACLVHQMVTPAVTAEQNSSFSSRVP
jgi:hypothetical protein